ncbi:hypothetical protein BX070DRAFT_232473 [Coemansia spiralis]|nr:hypothetical protein BX070DRAFT_232473 [Coemansia spiralis]
MSTIDSTILIKRRNAEIQLNLVPEAAIELGAAMDATSNNLEAASQGWIPAEARPFATKCNGFIEARDTEVVVIMSASAAIECSAPIYSIVVMTRMASDKQGSPIPAPGKGVLMASKEVSDTANADGPLCILNFKYRQCMLQSQLPVLRFWKRVKLVI